MTAASGRGVDLGLGFVVEPGVPLAEGLARTGVFAGVSRKGGAVGVHPGEEGVPEVTPGVPIFSSVLTRPPGGVPCVPGIGGGGPGANRFPSIGDGGCTPGAVVPGVAFSGPSAGRSGAGDCCPSASPASPHEAKHKTASVGVLLTRHLPVRTQRSPR